ncbi:MAG: pyridoxal phosphate-dependent aminotransferase, partial [Clostridia bacterium]|nr:pyridoxal phosphate-dependent aminotransferase [Clostridia bacterium]
MISEKMKNIMKSGSAIRAMFEEGKRLADIYGKENVYDFSLGNPSVPAPQKVNTAIKEVVDSVDSLTLHGYMSNSGYVSTRKAVADNLNKRFGSKFNENNIVMTVGAAGGLNVALKAIVNAGEEVAVIAPYFGEYNNYIANVDGKVAVIPPNPPTFQPDLTAFEKAINANTRAVIINTPNNPTGVIYSEDTLKKMSAILERKSKEYSSVIYLISDEPYRELAYDNEKVPFIPDFYANTIIGYSYSKSLSLPGERIGYLAIPSDADGFEELVSACNVAT